MLAVLAVAAVVVAVDVAVFVLARNGTAPADAQTGQTADLVAVIDAKSRHMIGRVRVGRSPTDVVAGYGGVWVLNKADGTLTQLDARTRRIVHTTPLDVTATDVTLGDGGVWLVGRLRGDVAHPLEFAKLERIDPKTGRVDRRFDTR